MLEGRCCAQCGESKPSSEFSWRGPDHKRLTSRCHACRRANHKENPLRKLGELQALNITIGRLFA